VAIKVNSDGLLNAIKITTYTLLTDDILLEPTPMLNPPIIIPIDDMGVVRGDEIIINIKYTMGGGLNTIQTTRKRNN
jgi:predicted RNA methylase